MRGKVGVARGERGFTLIETALALLVMLVAGLAASSLFIYAIKYNTGANDRAVSQALAQKQMETLRETAFSSLADSNQTVTSAGRQYSVTVSVCNDGSALCGGSASVKRLTVTVAPLSTGPAWALSQVQLMTYRSSVSTGTYY